MSYAPENYTPEASFPNFVPPEKAFMDWLYAEHRDQMLKGEAASRGEAAPDGDGSTDGSTDGSADGSAGGATDDTAEGTAEGATDDTAPDLPFSDAEHYSDLSVLPVQEYLKAIKKHMTVEEYHGYLRGHIIQIMTNLKNAMHRLPKAVAIQLAESAMVYMARLITSYEDDWREDDWREDDWRGVW